MAIILTRVSSSMFFYGYGGGRTTLLNDLYIFNTLLNVLYIFNTLELNICHNSIILLIIITISQCLIQVMGERGWLPPPKKKSVPKFNFDFYISNKFW